MVITETRLKKRKLEREREEVEDFFRARDQKAAAELSAQVRAQQQAQAEARKRQWVDSWQAYGLRSIPDDAPPQCRIEVHREVSAVLATIDLQSPEYIVRPLVDAAILKVIEPHRRRKEIAGIS